MEGIENAWLPVQATLREILANTRHSLGHKGTSKLGTVPDALLGWILEVSLSSTHLRQEHAEKQR